MDNSLNNEINELEDNLNLLDLLDVEDSIVPEDNGPVQGELVDSSGASSNRTRRVRSRGQKRMALDIQDMNLDSNGNPGMNQGAAAQVSESEADESFLAFQQQMKERAQAKAAEHTVGEDSPINRPPATEKPQTVAKPVRKASRPLAPAKPPPAPPSSGEKPTKPTSSGVVEADDPYAKYLLRARTEDWTDFNDLRFLFRAGTDKQGREIVVMVAHNLPARSVDQERVLCYLISVMDPVVANDYVLVYVHSGFRRQNKPTARFLKRCYLLFKRSYKKNLKQMYIVHPTFWVRTCFRLFRPFLSTKFWRKLRYIDDVADLFTEIPQTQLGLPDVSVQQLGRGQVRRPVFGEPLAEVFTRVELSTHGSALPAFLNEVLSYLGRCTNIEGLFRLNGSQAVIMELRANLDQGRPVSFDQLDDPHSAAGFFKLWLRSLPEPLIPYGLYDQFVATAKRYFQVMAAGRSSNGAGHSGSGSGGGPAAPGLGRGELSASSPAAFGSDHSQTAISPDDVAPLAHQLVPLIQQLDRPNRLLLGSLLDLLHSVQQNQSVNLMTAANLGIVFAPNVFRPPNDNIGAMLSDGPILNEMMAGLISEFPFVLGKIQT